MQAQGSEEEEAALSRVRRLADLLPSHFAKHQMGFVIRGDLMQCSCHGGVRRGVRRLRTYPRVDQYDAALYRNPLQ